MPHPADHFLYEMFKVQLEPIEMFILWLITGFSDRGRVSILEQAADLDRLCRLGPLTPCAFFFKWVNLATSKVVRTTFQEYFYQPVLSAGAYIKKPPQNTQTPFAALIALWSSKIAVKGACLRIRLIQVQVHPISIPNKECYP